MSYLQKIDDQEQMKFIKKYKKRMFTDRKIRIVMALTTISGICAIVSLCLTFMGLIAELLVDGEILSLAVMNIVHKMTLMSLVGFYGGLIILIFI